MDPNENLREQREIRERIAKGEEGPADVSRLLELAHQMDEWLSKGYVLPKEWAVPSSEAQEFYDLRKRLNNDSYSCSRPIDGAIGWRYNRRTGRVDLFISMTDNSELVIVPKTITINRREKVRCADDD